MVDQAEFFKTDERGSVAVIVAVLLVPLLGFGALAIDLSYASLVKSQLQTSADAGALGAVQMLPDTAAARSKALDLVTKNVPSTYGTVAASADISFGNYKPATKTFTANGTPVNAVQVSSSRTAAKGNLLPRFFSAALGISASELRASGLAYRPKGVPPTCVYVLDPSGAGAFQVSGGGAFSVPNCGVAVNSTASDAAKTGGSSSASAKKFCITGSYSGGFSPTPTTGCPAMSDPLASVPEPAVPGGGCKTSAQIASSTWTPGVYCGNIILPASVTLQSGLYYFQGSVLNMTNGQTLSGSKVIMFFDSSSTLNNDGSARMSISAPDTGTYEGVAIFQSRSAVLNTQMKMSGSTELSVDGTIYAPRAQMIMTGNSSAEVKSGYLVVNRLQYTGSSKFSVGTTPGPQAVYELAKPSLVQ